MLHLLIQILLKTENHKKMLLKNLQPLCRNGNSSCFVFFNRFHEPTTVSPFHVPEFDTQLESPVQL